MQDEHVDVRTELDYLRKMDKQAVQEMLLTALQHGFRLEELTALAGHYQTSVAFMQYCNNECTVFYASAGGYFSQCFGDHYQEAVAFLGQFEYWRFR